MKKLSLLSVMVLTLTSISTFAASDIKSCRDKADLVVMAVGLTYKNPAGVELSNSSENINDSSFLYEYNFDYAVPYDETGSAQMITKVIAVTLNNRDCSLKSVNVF